MRSLLIAAVLALPVAALAAETPSTIAAEVEKGVTAYNAQDIAYYENTLSTDAVYIAEDGAVFTGKEKVLRLFSRIFAKTPVRSLAVTDVVTGAKGDVAWTRFGWTLTMGADSRRGITSILFARAGDEWQVLQIQSTPAGHAKAAAPHAASPTPAPPPKP
jgi:ketosteroid isomerase-like protein